MVSPRLRRKISMFNNIMVKLANFAQRSYDELSDIEMDAIERNIHIMIEILVDLGNHIIAEKGFAKPSTYRDVARILGRHGVITSDEQKVFEGLVGLRNILVHMYADVDRELLFKAIKDEIQVWRSLFNKLVDYMVKEGIDP